MQALDVVRWKKFSRKACWLLPAVLIGCGGGGSEPARDPLDRYRNQSVVWQRCDPHILGDSPLSEQQLAHVQCARIVAPMDWSHPERGDISLALMRTPSPDPDQRRGSLLINPGGPGSDGLSMALFLMRLFDNSNPADPVGALQLQLQARYDMVGFSPRGVGASTQLTCATPEHQRYVDMSPSASALTEAVLDDQLYNLQKQSEACARNPLTPYINSDATARDMDLMRHLLGDDKLHYLGYSYGTWLGAWYAALFPEKVGRMVLDSTVDFTSNLDSLGTTQALARQRLQDEVMLPYAARHPDIANLGTEPAAMHAMVASLDPQLEGILSQQLSGDGYYREETGSYIASWLAASVLQSLITQPLPRDTQPDWERLLDLAQEQQFSPHPQMQALALQKVEQLVGGMAEGHPTQPTQATVVQNATAHAVRCNDTPAVTDPVLWKSNIRNLAAQAPLHYMVDEIVRCIHWGGPSVTKPSLERLKPLDLLLVQSEYDSATATPGAMRFFAELEGAHMVYVPEEHTHGLFPYAISATDDAFKCVNRTVVRYLLGDSPQERTTTCQAEPKLWDAMHMRSQSLGGTAAFLNLEQSQQLRDAMGSAMQP